MPATLKFKGGNTAQEDLRTGAANELTVDTEALELRLHDGSTPGGKAIGSGGGGMPSIVRGTFGSSYTQLPDNISKFDGYSTRPETNTAVYVPCLFHSPTLVTQMGVSVGTADGTSTDTRVAIYQQDAVTGLAGSLLFGSAHISVAAAGFAYETLGTPLTLHGFYWIAIKSDSTVVTLADFDPSSSQVFVNPMGVNPAAGTMRFPKTDSIVGAFGSNPTDDGAYADNGSLWVPIYQ